MNLRTVASIATASFFAVIAAAPVLSADAQKAAVAGNVNQARVLAEEAAGSNWLVNGRDFTGETFQPAETNH